MDRLSRPDLPQLSSLTAADLPRLLAERETARHGLRRAKNLWDEHRWLNRLSWIDEQIAYVKLLEREARRTK